MNQTIVTMKAFGDFVIACSAARRAQSAPGMDGLTVVAGEHVRSLASALGLDRAVRFIGDDSWTDVPAAFDVRKCGVLSALKSLRDLRHRLDALPAGMELVFDHVGWRESFIGGGRSLRSLPVGSGNIYIAYDRLFESLGYKISAAQPERTHSVRDAIIIPGARMEYKKIPSRVIEEIATELEHRGVKTRVITLAGESIELPVGVHARRLPRSFDQLAAAVRASDLVVSADSLPSHLSEFLGTPIFVSTPVPNPYWLPRSAYLTNGWATFADLQPLRTWLDSHLRV